MEDSDIQIGDKVKIVGATKFNDEKGIVVARNIVDAEYLVKFDNGDCAWKNSTELTKLPKNLKQVTIRVEAFTTVTVADDWNGDADSIPMKLDVYDTNDDTDSPVIIVHETDITAKEVTHVVNINDL